MDSVHDNLAPTIVHTIAIGKFKQTCLRLLEEVRQTGRPILITKRGQAVAQVLPPSQALRGSFAGAMRSRGKILGDIVAPASSRGDWKALKD
jgi:prevent-host-death family protein